MKRCTFYKNKINLNKNDFIKKKKKYKSMLFELFIAKLGYFLF